MGPIRFLFISMASIAVGGCCERPVENPVLPLTRESVVRALDALVKRKESHFENFPEDYMASGERVQFVSFPDDYAEPGPGWTFGGFLVDLERGQFFHNVSYDLGRKESAYKIFGDFVPVDGKYQAKVEGGEVIYRIYK